MVAILGKADCGTVAETANKRWLSEQPTYSWREHFGELAPVDVEGLRPLDRLTRLLASAISSRCARRSINHIGEPADAARAHVGRGVPSSRCCSPLGVV